MSPIKGLSTPEAVKDHELPVGFQQTSSLNALPPPDYDDYFDLLRSLDSQNIFFPVLPVETSRGCWWQQSYVPDKTTPKMSGHPAGCAFCNLNLQWEGYRAKDPSQALKEIVEDAGGSGVSCAVSIPPEWVSYRNVQLPFNGTQMTQINTDFH